MKRALKNQLKLLTQTSGFTLVELMIVVAIIGTLASIAVPQYSKFQAKSRQTEVKIQLGAAYTVEQSFAAENSTYTACLGQVGYNRDGTKFYYTIGFSDATAVGNGAFCKPGGGGASGDCETYQWSYTGGAYTAGASCTIAVSSTNFPANIAEPNSGGVTTEAFLVTGASNVKANVTPAISSTAFVIGGAGNIMPKATLVDGWSIDNNKQILNTQSGLQ